MMRSFLSLLALLLVTVACEKESIAPSNEVSSKLTLAEDYLIKSQSILLFANLEVDNETNRISGFVIDKKGDFYKIFNMKDHGIDLTSNHISDNTMRQILQYGNKDAAMDVSKVELVDHTKTASKLQRISEMDESTAVNSTQIQLAFRRDLAHNSASTCVTPFDHGPSHHQIVIEATGRYNFMNDEKISPTLSAYLNHMVGTSTPVGAN